MYYQATANSMYNVIFKVIHLKACSLVRECVQIYTISWISIDILCTSQAKHILSARYVTFWALFSVSEITEMDTIYRNSRY